MCQFKCISGKNILCIFTFVKTFNHSPAQNLSNKKTGAFCVFCGQIYCSDSLPSFDTHALYFVRPLYTVNIRKQKIQHFLLTVEPRAVYPHCFDADPDPDPDQNLNADPDQNLNADPDPDPGW